MYHNVNRNFHGLHKPKKGVKKLSKETKNKKHWSMVDSEDCRDELYG